MSPSGTAEEPGRSTAESRWKRGLMEVSGGFGDFGTIVPLLCGVALATRMGATWIFVFAGLAMVITGWYYRFPIAVEPLKVVAVIAIAGSLSGPEIAATGILIGGVFLLLGYWGAIWRVSRYIPGSVIRGVQLAIAIMLVIAALGFARESIIPFCAGIAVIVVFSVVRRLHGIPDLSALFLIGLSGVLFLVGNRLPAWALPPLPGLVIPGVSDFSRVILLVVIPQAVVTLTNSVLATSQLAQDLGKQVPERKLSRTIGVFNLAVTPFGGFPLCHGAGGLAAQYRFGARTGYADVIGGLVLVGFGLALGDAVGLFVPAGIFGAMLVFVAFEMALHSIQTDSRVVTAVTGLAGAFLSMTSGFFLGLVLAAVIAWMEKRRKAPS